VITGVQVTAMAVGERAVLQTFRELGQAIGLYGVRCLVTALEGTCKHGPAEKVPAFGGVAALPVP